VASHILDNQSITLNFENLKLHKIFTSSGAEYDPVQMIIFSQTDNFAFAMLVDKGDSSEEEDRERSLIVCFDIWYGGGRGSVLCNLRHFKTSNMTEDQIGEEISDILRRLGNDLIPHHPSYTPCPTCSKKMVDLNRTRDRKICDVQMLWQPRTDRSGAFLRIAASPPDKEPQGLASAGAVESSLTNPISDMAQFE